MSHISRSVLARYGLLGLPLAFAGLPLYVHLPRYYSAVHGMELALIGTLLLVARLFDTVLDPFIGWAADRWPHLRARAMTVSAVLLGITYAALFYPVTLTGTALAFWLLAMLMLVYASFSVLMILYNGLGVELAAGDYHDNTRVTAAREGMVLIGVIFAAVLPHVLGNALGMEAGFVWFSAVFILMLCLGVWVLLSMKRLFSLPRSASSLPTIRFRASLNLCFSTRELRWCFALFFINALPVAITSTLFIFFVEDKLQRPDATGYLLALYFLFAALSVPIWSLLTRAIGKRRALMGGMIMAIGAFIWTYGLQAGEMTSFAIICALCGIAVGGDMAILPSLLGDALRERPDVRSFSFGVWNFLTKLSLALAAGVTLPLLGALGYQPGGDNSSDALGSLGLAYALLPCALKLLSLLVLSISPLDLRRLP